MELIRLDELCSAASSAKIVFVHSMVKRVRRLIRHAGFDVCRFPGRQFGHLRHRIFAQRDVSLILDVGANRGQWAEDVRGWGYSGRIVSFEPGQSAFDALVLAATRDPSWDVRKLAVGDRDCEVTLNVAANSGASSSVLPMLGAHLLAAPQAKYSGTELVQQVTLADLWSDLVRAGDKVYVKADVQGYEKQVLAGAGDLKDVVAVELELSFVPLYAHSLLVTDMLAEMSVRGFHLAELEPVFHDPRTGRLLQANGIFIRVEDESAG
jgi:FkbM family methyltransferase